MMMGMNRLSTYHKILAMSLFIISLLSSVGALIVWEAMDDMVAQQLKKRGTEIASHVATLSARKILVDDFLNLYELVNQTVANSEDIRYILIFNNNNDLLAHSFSDGIPQGLLNFNPKLPLSQNETTVLYSNEGVIHDIMVPIENGAVGFVRVGMTEQYTRNSVMQHIRELLIVTLIVCSLAVALSSKIARLITKPISNLGKVAEAITQGNLTARADIVEDSEMGKLSIAFNEMATSLITANGDKEQLLFQLQAKEQMRKTLLHKLITAQEDERKRISRELHDETSQALTSLMVTMRILAEEATTEMQKEALLTSRDIAADILREVHNLAVELRPPILDDLGLVAGIEKYAERFGDRYGLVVTLNNEVEMAKINGEIAVVLYRIIQESLNNVVKHAGANEVTIIIEDDSVSITLMIVDNGKGISAEDLQRAQQENRLGIYGMSERAELIGGSLTIEAAVHGGTIVCVNIPK